MKAKSRYFGRIQETGGCATGAVDILKAHPQLVELTNGIEGPVLAADRWNYAFCGQPIPQSIHNPRDFAIDIFEPIAHAEDAGGGAPHIRGFRMCGREG